MFPDLSLNNKLLIIYFALKPQNVSFSGVSRGTLSSVHR